MLTLLSEAIHETWLGSLLTAQRITGPPAAKKQKTKPAAAADKDEVAENGANGGDDNAEDKEDEEDGDAEDEDAADTAKTSGPAQAAAKAKGDDVPKEADLAEVEDDEDDE